MKVKDLMEMKVSLYRRVSDRNQMMTITLDDWLHKVSVKAKGAIEDLRKVNETDTKGAKAMKAQNLPCVTISGVFEGERKADMVSSANPIICVDIDALPEGMDWEKVKRKVFDLPYVFYSSLSCRGNGVFALVYYNDEESLSSTFRYLEWDLRQMGIEIDRACKDICRLRFVSYDANPLEKEEVELYERNCLDEFIDPVFNYSIEKKRESSYGELDDYFTYKTISYVIEHCGYRADNYEDWLLDGFRLATFNQYGHNLFMYLSSVSEGFNDRAAEKKWTECVKNTKMTKDSLSHYYKVAKDRLGSDWVRIVRNS